MVQTYPRALSKGGGFIITVTIIIFIMLLLLLLLKFCRRIVKQFPTDPDINDTVNKTTTEFLERQLYFITKSISYFSVNQNTNSNNVHSLSREKLTDLWLNKRKKAINTIKNNGNLTLNSSSSLLKLKNNTTILDKTFGDFFTFQHNFSSPQVKRNLLSPKSECTNCPTNCKF